MSDSEREDGMILSVKVISSLFVFAINSSLRGKNKHLIRLMIDRGKRY